MPTSTALMDLKIPNPGETNYPTSVSDSFTSIDSHDHTAGKGTPIVLGGLAAGSVNAAALTTNSVGVSNIIDGSITTVKVVDANITKAKLSAVDLQKSDMNPATFTTSSTTFVDVTGLSLTITSTGRPIYVSVVPSVEPVTFPVGAGSSALQLFDATGADFGANLSLYRGASLISGVNLNAGFVLSASSSSSTSLVVGAPGSSVATSPAGGTVTATTTTTTTPSKTFFVLTVPPAITVIDPIAAGTYTYKIQAKVNAATNVLSVVQCRLIAFEL